MVYFVILKNISEDSHSDVPFQSNSISSECVRFKILSASDQRVVCILAATIAAMEHWSVHTQTFCIGFALSYWHFDYYLFVQLWTTR